MGAAALITIAATGIGLVAGSVRALGLLQKQRARRARAASAEAQAPPVPPIGIPAPQAQDTPPLVPAPPAQPLPPRDHFALSRGDGAVRALPGGTVPLLFTDIVGWTAFRWRLNWARPAWAR